MRKPSNIPARISTVRNAFVQAVLPVNLPDDVEKQGILTALGQSSIGFLCMYCGDLATDWDHLNPLVSKGRPTGHTSGPGNLVPACGPCNQSKSGQPWRVWMTGSAARSPANRGVPDLKERVARLEAFERDHPSVLFKFEAYVGTELWQEYWQLCEEIVNMMKKAQKVADRIRQCYPPPP